MTYTDDTQLYVLLDSYPESAPKSLDRDLEAVTGWLQQSQLSLIE